MKADHVNVVRAMPEDYHCDCPYCQRYIGELRAEDGSYYSRLERRQYYSKEESGPNGHIAKTPLHVARWAIQRYSEPGDCVLDPTAGAGTTLVEAITQDRNAVGVELQTARIVELNTRANANPHAFAEVWEGDARHIGQEDMLAGRQFDLVVNNPPYSGDESNPGKTFKGTLRYEDGTPNLAFLKEDETYWNTMRDIYRECVRMLKPGGRFVIAVKDMMRNKKPFLLHRDLCLVLDDEIGLEYEGMALLRHHPGTLFLNSYGKRYGVEPPKYQTINVFRKPEAE